MIATSLGLHVATALLCCTVSVLAVRAMRRQPRWQPLAGWSFVGFVATVAVASVWRAGMPWLPREPAWLLGIVSLEFLAALLLALVFTQAARQRFIVPQLVERARRSAREYDRARHDYEQLVRHRIANPLAAVQGIAHTLVARPDLPDATRLELVAALVDAADELARVSLDPLPTGPEEAELRAVPAVHVDEPRGVRPAGTVAATG